MDSTLSWCTWTIFPFLRENWISWKSQKTFLCRWNFLNVVCTIFTALVWCFNIFRGWVEDYSKTGLSLKWFSIIISKIQIFGQKRVKPQWKWTIQVWILMRSKRFNPTIFFPHLLKWLFPNGQPHTLAVVYTTAVNSQTVQWDWVHATDPANLPPLCSTAPSLLGPR